MIFDEIDTGISGEAARQVGIIMKELAAKRQVICITHQPQIAGKADAHFFVYKEIVKQVSPSGRDTVKTNIRQLTPPQDGGGSYRRSQRNLCCEISKINIS